MTIDVYTISDSDSVAFKCGSSGWYMSLPITDNSILEVIYQFNLGYCWPWATGMYRDRVTYSYTISPDTHPHCFI